MNKRKKIVISFAWIFAVFIGSIVTLEILSRTSNCSTARYSESMPACGNHLYMEDANVENYLNELSEKYGQMGTHINVL